MANSSGETLHTDHLYTATLEPRHSVRALDRKIAPQQSQISIELQTQLNPTFFNGRLLAIACSPSPARHRDPPARTQHHTQC